MAKRTETNIFIPDIVKITFRPMDVANNVFWVDGSDLDGNESIIKIDAERFLKSIKESIEKFEEAVRQNRSEEE